MFATLEFWMYIWLALKSHILFALNNTSTTKNEIQKIPCCVILGGPLLWEPSSQFSEYRYAKMNCKNKACSYQGISWLTWEAQCCCRRVCKLSEFRMSFLIKTREGGKKHKNTKKKIPNQIWRPHLNGVKLLESWKLCNIWAFSSEWKMF